MHSRSCCPWSGLRVNDEGKVTRAAGTATTLDEMAELAGRLRTELRRCGVHAEVVRYCEEEVLRRSLFHAVFEATKGVSDRLRQMISLTADGGELVDQCFGGRAGPRWCGSTPTAQTRRPASIVA